MQIRYKKERLWRIRRRLMRRLERAVLKHARSMLQLDVVIGVGDHAVAVDLSEIKARHICQVGLCSDQSDVSSHPDALAIASDAADLIFALHLLESLPGAKDALKEFNRVITPDGYLLISCYNPWNFASVVRFLWSQCLYLAQKLGLKQVEPKQLWWLSPNRLTEWLSLLGFEVQNVRYLFPDANPRKHHGALSFISLIVERLIYGRGAAFVVVAQKREPGMRRIKLAFKTLKLASLTSGGALSVDVPAKQSRIEE